jgi:hypothetical protein
MNTLKIAVIHSFPLVHGCTPTDNHSHMNTHAFSHTSEHILTFIHTNEHAHINILRCENMHTHSVTPRYTHI